MKAKELYPDIYFFVTLKELPLCPVGSIVSICDVEGCECLYINGIEFPLNMAQLCPDWFLPATPAVRDKMIKDSLYQHWKDLGKSEEEIKQLWEAIEQRSQTNTIHES